MRVLVCGGRKYNDATAFIEAIQSARQNGLSCIIEGGASGADALARTYARVNRIRCETFKADWKKHGNAAGPIRNQRMIDEGKPDLVIAFPGGRGTADMVRKAIAAGIPVKEVS